MSPSKTLTLTFTLLLTVTCIAQEPRKLKVSDFPARMRQLEGPIPLLALNSRTEVGDVGVLDLVKDRVLGSVTTSYTYKLLTKISDSSGIFEVISTTHVPAQPTSAVGSPGNLRTTYSKPKVVVETRNFLLQNHDLTNKADGSDLRFSGTFFVSGTSRAKLKESEGTFLVIEPFDLKAATKKP